MDEESTSCYGLLEAERCHLLVGRPGRYALVGRPLSQAAAKRLRLAVFGGPDLSNPLGYNLRVYCVDDTPHALQVRGGEKKKRREENYTEDLHLGHLADAFIQSDLQ